MLVIAEDDMVTPRYLSDRRKGVPGAGDPEDGWSLVFKFCEEYNAALIVSSNDNHA